MKTKIYISANYIYKVEVTGNEEKPLNITREYSRERGNQWCAMSNKDCPNVGQFIMNQGGVDALVAKCAEVENLVACVEEYNAAAKAAHEKNQEEALIQQAMRESQIRAIYERLFSGEVTETNVETVGALLRYLNTQNWGLWELPKMTIGYSCNQYDCDGKQATTIKLDQPIMVNGEPGTMFQVGAPHGHLMKYRRI